MTEPATFDDAIAKALGAAANLEWTQDELRGTWHANAGDVGLTIYRLDDVGIWYAAVRGHGIELDAITLGSCTPQAAMLAAEAIALHAVAKKLRRLTIAYEALAEPGSEAAR